MDNIKSPWLGLKQVVAPTGAIISLDEAKAHLRVDHDDDDDYITALIASATAYIEGPKGIGIALLTQQWRRSLNSFPYGQAIELPLGPVQSVDEIVYFDQEDVQQTWDPSEYEFDLDQTPVIVVPRWGHFYPISRPKQGSLKITYTCGFGDNAADVPADIRHAAKWIVGLMYREREPVVGTTATATPTDLPWTINAIFDRYRTGMFG